MSGRIVQRVPPASEQSPTVLTLFKENLLCARGALAELHAAGIESPDEFDSDETTRARALFERCDEGLRSGHVAMTESDTRLALRALRLVEDRWSMSDRQNLFGVGDSDWDLTVMLVSGAIE